MLRYLRTESIQNQFVGGTTAQNMCRRGRLWIVEGFLGVFQIRGNGFKGLGVTIRVVG